MAILGDKKLRPRFASNSLAHVHRFRGGSAFIEERRACERQAGELRDHGLKVEQRLEAALRDLGLVRRVGRVPRRILEDIAEEHAGHDGVDIAHADVRVEELVLAAEVVQRKQRLGFAAFNAGDRHGWVVDFEFARKADRRRQRGANELRHRRVTALTEHGARIRSSVRDVASVKSIGGAERGGDRRGHGRGGCHGGHRG